MSVDFKALSDVIDALGGMELELTAEEVVHMNNYCVETSEVTGKDYERIEPGSGRNLPFKWCAGDILRQESVPQREEITRERSASGL